MKKWLFVDFEAKARGRSPADAYAVLADLENWPRWTGVVLATKWVGEPGWREGAKFAFKVGERGIGVWLNVAVVTVRENAEIGWGVKIPGLLDVVHNFTFEKDGRDVKVRTTEYFAGPLGLLLSIPFGGALRKGDGQWLRDLAQRIERG